MLAATWPFCVHLGGSLNLDAHYAPTLRRRGINNPLLVMLTMKLIKSVVDKLPVPPMKANGKSQQTFFYDDALPGFGLRIGSGGTKTFILDTRIKGRTKRITIGKYGIFTPEQARQHARELSVDIARGKNPIQERKTNKIKHISLDEVFEDYLITRKTLRPATVHDYRRCIQGALKEWCHLPLDLINKDMVEKKHRALGNKSEARANDTMRVLRAVFNHAMAKYEDDNHQPIFNINPVDRLKHVRAWYPKKRRQTIISIAELKPWYDATFKLTSDVTRDYFHFLLLTGLRRTEAATIKWEHIDRLNKTVTLPKTKNGCVHILPLTQPLLHILDNREHVRINEYVFGRDTHRGHLHDPTTATLRMEDFCGVKFSLHDLRRTFITIAESLDIPAYALKRLLNHKNPNDVTEGYIVPNIERLRKPMQLISDYIMKIVNRDDEPRIIPITANHALASDQLKSRDNTSGKPEIYLLPNSKRSSIQ